MVSLGKHYLLFPVTVSFPVRRKSVDKAILVFHFILPAELAARVDHPFGRNLPRLTRHHPRLEQLISVQVLAAVALRKRALLGSVAIVGVSLCDGGDA